jgi:hypothetical protein
VQRLRAPRQEGWEQTAAPLAGCTEAGDSHTEDSSLGSIPGSLPGRNTEAAHILAAAVAAAARSLKVAARSRVAAAPAAAREHSLAEAQS